MPSDAPLVFPIPIRCHACDALVVWLRDDQRNGMREDVEAIRRPDGSPIVAGVMQKRCPSCGAGFQTIDVDKRKTM